MAWKEVETQAGNTWKPKEEGDTLIGEVKEIVEGNFGRRYLIEDEKGEEFLTPSHKVLQNRLAKIAVGTKVKIVYDGETPPAVRGQSAMQMYRVFVEE